MYGGCFKEPGVILTKIVIVDDALLIRMQLKKFFEETMNFEVAGIGGDGIQAVDLYRKHKPDLLTIDMTMPNMSGLEAIEQIIGEWSSANILVITAIQNKDLINKALNAGAKGYVNKPLYFKSEEFVQDLIDDVNDALEDG